MNLFFSGLIITVFACIAAVLSASETAITMASRLRLHQLIKKGHKRAELLLSLQSQMSTLISTILLANTCLFAAIASLATKLMDNVLGDFGIFVASFVMGTFMTLYIEVIPKIYAYRRPEWVGLALAPMLRVLRNILRPITRLIDFVAHRSLSFFGVHVPPERTSLEDLQGAIDLHTGDGPSIMHERAMLRSILDLSNVTVEEIMIHRKNIVSFPIDLPQKELCNKILGVPYTRVPLWKESPDNIIGVVNIKSLARALQEIPTESLDIESLMHTPWFIPETTTLFSQLQSFKEKHSHQAFVVDEYGSLLGMVTLEDILEEIVGEITDEHDIELAGVRVTSQGEYLIQGSVTLRDLHRQYDWALGDSASTLAGLILHETRSIPQVGAIINIKGFTMEVMRRHHQQLTLIRVKPPQ